MTDDQLPALDDRVTELRRRAEAELAGKIIAVMSGKGGVGKTLIALEMAHLFNAVLVDFDYDDGNATRALGYLHERYQRAPLLDAFANGTTPRPRAMHKRPDLVPGHPDFEANQPSPEATRDALTAWAKEWNRPVVVDTHPGGSDAVYGAIAASDVVVSPAVLGTRELEALEGQLRELQDYPVMLVPNRVPSVPPRPELKKLRELSQTYAVEVASPVYEHTWYTRRKLRTVLSGASSFSKRSEPFVEELTSMAQEVMTYAA